MTWTKLASVCFVAARKWIRQQVQDHADAESPPECGRSQSTTTCESSYVLQSTTPVLVCTTKYYSSTTLYYKVLLQYYSVLQSTTPVLLCTTTYYSSTTLYYSSTSLYYKVLLQYYKVLLQYYSVLQSTTPVLQSTTPVLLCTTKYYLLCTTKNYSSTTLYYKVLLQYYSVLQSTPPVLLCTTKYYLLCTTKNYSSTTLYYKVLLQYYSVLQSTTPVLISWLIHVTYEMSFTMRGTTGVILQHQRILRLPRKMTVITAPRHIWNVIYNARCSRCHPPTSPNTAPVTQNDFHEWSSSRMKRYLQCAEQQVSSSNITKYCACHAKWPSWLILVTYETLFTMRCTTGVILQHHRILRLPRKWTLETFTKISRKQLKRDVQCATVPSRIWEWSDHETVRPQPALKPRLLFALATSIFYWKIQHFALGLSFQISPNTAPATKSDSSTSPNTAPATQSDCHDWSLSHMKRYPLFTMRGTTGGILQHHRILRLPRKMTVMTDPRHIWNVIYNARNNRWHPPTSPNTAPATQIDSLTFHRNFSKTAETSFTMWGRSEHDPRMIRAWNRHSATRLASEVTFRAQHEHFLLKNTTFRAPAIIPNFTQCCACHEKWQFNITKYCACHRKWLSWLILVRHETSFTMRGAIGVILQRHRTLRLPRKMIVMTDPRHIWNVIYNARNNRWHPPTSPNTAPATQIDSWNFHKISRKQLKRHLQCTTDPSMIWAGSDHETVRPQLACNWGYISRPPRAFSIEKCNISRSGYHSKFHDMLRLPRKVTLELHQILRHEKWHLNCTKCCACHEKWHLNFTKCCTWHEKWHLNFTKCCTESLLKRISSYNLLRISFQTNLFSHESNLLRISSQTNLISYESLLKRI